jgi:3-deoxy-D-manno-octulosonic acid (KDO) 8-phosphate synthase
VHPDPETALSDGDQSLALPAFASLVTRVAAFAAAAGRSIETPVASNGRLAARAAWTAS